MRSEIKGGFALLGGAAVLALAITCGGTDEPAAGTGETPVATTDSSTSTMAPPSDGSPSSVQPSVGGRPNGGAGGGAGGGNG